MAVRADAGIGGRGAACGDLADAAVHRGAGRHRGPAPAGGTGWTGVRRIGIDEKAWRKGHRYITVIIDHDAGRIVWAAEGRNKDTLRRFFGDLGPRAARGC